MNDSELGVEREVLPLYGLEQFILLICRALCDSGFTASLFLLHVPYIWLWNGSIFLS